MKIKYVTVVPRLSSDAASVGDLHAASIGRVFLLPGVYGDEPQLLNLREHLADRLTFHTIALPDVTTPVAQLSSIPETARSVADDIMTLQREGPIYLVGFSFGASLALEVASQLGTKRTVAYIGLIDGPLKHKNLRRAIPLTPMGLYSVPFRILKKPKAKFISRRAHRKLLNGSAFSETQRRSLLLSFRVSALDRWEPRRCKTEGFVFLSGAIVQSIP